MEVVKPLINHYRLKIVDGVFAATGKAKAGKYGKKLWFLVLFRVLGRREEESAAGVEGVRSEPAAQAAEELSSLKERLARLERDQAEVMSTIARLRRHLERMGAQ
jgi:hypothetical protein